jgi:hypothetical protein
MGIRTDMLEDQCAHGIWVGEGLQHRNIKSIPDPDVGCQGKGEESTSVMAKL